MGLGRERAQRHAGGVKTLVDGLDRFDFVDRDRRDILAQPEQIAQHRHRPAVHERGVFQVLVVVTALHRFV